MLNTKNVFITVSGLMPYSKYIYKFSGAGANWPTTATPATGIISTNNLTSKTIKTKVHFCASTGICPLGEDGVFDYSIIECQSDPVNLYSNMEFSLKEYDTNNVVFDDIVEVTCEDCLPKINITMPTAATLINNNTYTISTLVAGLVPKQTYSYRFIGIEANWPSTLSKTSGQFIAKDTTEILLTDLTFCPTSGMCSSANKVIGNYSLDNSCIFGTTSQYSKVKFELTPLTCNIGTIFTDVLNVTCVDCLPKITVTLPNNTVLKTANTNRYDVTSWLSGLRPNENYTYEYITDSSNWPTVMTPTTGSFTATGRTHTLSSKMMFCSPKSICPSGTEGLLSYSFDDSASKILKENVLSTTIKLKVNPETCDIPEKTSLPFTLSCSGCLPSFSYATINFADTPEIKLDTGCCSGVRAITVGVSGAVPGDKYNYRFDSASDNVDFSPTTGVIYFGANGNGAINTVLGVNLIESQQVIINCVLQHDDTDIETIDFLAVKCDGTCAT
jgi:hypothetical protein